MDKNYFSLREIYVNCSNPEISKAQKSPVVRMFISKLRNTLNVVREYVNEPIYVTSWYRDCDHNKRVGGVRNSHHLTGGAADVTCSNLDNLLQKCLSMSQFTQIIRYDAFIHLSIIPTKNLRYVDKRKTHKNQ